MEIVFATNNHHKLEEITSMLDGKFRILGLRDLDFSEDIPEDFETLEENALQKARYIHDRFKMNCFADDTGLEVDSLDGAPGVYSARYSRIGNLRFPEMEASEGNIHKLLIELDGQVNRSARFRTVIALIMDDKQYLFEGEVKGEITLERSGAKGFGYDPVFLPEGYSQTFAEMDLAEKNKISHRSRAVSKLAEFLVKM